MFGAVIDSTLLVGGDQGNAANSSLFLLTSVFIIEKHELRVCRYQLSSQDVIVR